VIAVQGAIDNLGRMGEAGKPATVSRVPVPPVPNDPTTAAWQEYAVAKALKSAAEKREERARKAALATVHDMDKKPLGDFIATDDAFVFAKVTKVKGAARLNRDMVLQYLVTKCKHTVEQATFALAECMKEDNPSVRCDMTLKQ